MAWYGAYSSARKCKIWPRISKKRHSCQDEKYNAY